MDDVRFLRNAKAGGHRADTARPAGPDWSELVSNCAQGDEQAFAALYDLSSTRVYGMVLRVLRDAAQAAEITQEVYLHVWREAARYDPVRGSVLSWLLTIAHRRAVDRVRAVEASNARDERYRATHTEPDYDQVAEQAHASLDAERVRKVLAELTDSQREAINLAYFGGYTHGEVAQLLHLPLGTVKTRIRDGLIRLRDALGVNDDRA